MGRIGKEGSWGIAGRRRKEGVIELKGIKKGSEEGREINEISRDKEGKGVRMRDKEREIK